MPSLIAVRSLALLVMVVGTLIGSQAGAGPILGTYQAQGVIVEVGSLPEYVHWTTGLSLGGTVAMDFTLQDVTESAPGVYDYAAISWNLVAAPQFNYVGGPALGGAGSVQLSGDTFDLHLPDGLLTFGGTTAYGIQFDFSAIGLVPGTGLRLPTSTAIWEVRVLDPNGQVLLRATSVPEPSIGLLVALSVGAFSIGVSSRLCAHQGQDRRAAG